MSEAKGDSDWTLLNSKVDELKEEHDEDLAGNESDSQKDLNVNSGEDLNESIKDISLEEVKHLKKELILLRQQSLELIELSKEHKPLTEGSSKLRVSWKFLVFASILILAFIGTLSNYWSKSSVTLKIQKELVILKSENEMLKLELRRLQNEILTLHKHKKQQSADLEDRISNDNKEHLSFRYKDNSVNRMDGSLYSNCDSDIAGFCTEPDHTTTTTKTETGHYLEDKRPAPIGRKYDMDSKDRRQDKQERKVIKRKSNSSEEKNDKYKPNQSRERKNKKFKDYSDKRNYRKGYNSEEKKSKNRKNYSRENSESTEDLFESREQYRYRKKS